MFGSRYNFSTPLECYGGKVDLEPQQTPNPYSQTAQAACMAIRTLSTNRKCSLILRTLGAAAPLVTFIGAFDQITARSAAEALKNIRHTHIESIEAFAERVVEEKTVP